MAGLQRGPFALRCDRSASVEMTRTQAHGGAPACPVRGLASILTAGEPLVGLTF